MEAKLDRIDSRLSNLELETRAAWKGIGQKLDSILLASSEREIGIEAENPTISRKDDVIQLGAVLERKRLKERLKDAAADHEHKLTTGGPVQPISLVERIFGIHAADARAGKERSRSSDLNFGTP